MERLSRLEHTDAAEMDKIGKELRARSKDVKGLLERQKPQARRILKTLLVDRLEFAPIQGAYRFSGKWKLGGLLETATIIGGPNGNRTRVSALRGRRPRPLDDRAER